MNKETNIVLVGFMATGKSTVGRLLAERLNRVFVDVDTAIEHRTGLTIPRIFADYSEPFFRAIERGICHELVLQKDLVIATGGGAIMDDVTRQTLVHHSFVVALTANPETIEARIKQTDSRPLRGQWRELLEARRPVYESMPYRVDTSAKSPESVTEEILALWQNVFE